MEASVIRLLWSIVLTLPPEEMGGFSDDAIVRYVLHELDSRISLSVDDQVKVRQYLTSRHVMIREMLQKQAM
jgi:hypothetical protein